MTTPKICAVTSTRADYGLLYWVLKEIAGDPALKLQIIATGMHLSPEFGNTASVIEEDGFGIDATVEMLLSSDTRVGAAKSMGMGVMGMADAFERLDPDLVLLLGDRFEILAAAAAATILGRPIAHIAGGDITQGAFDEAIRHSITKMSHLHFVTNEESGRRVRQMGEEPARVFNVGSPGLDYITRTKLLSRDELGREIGFDFRRRNLLVTFHPSTLDSGSPVAQTRELLAALEGLGADFGLIFTKGSADPGSAEISSLIDEFVSTHPNARAYVSLGQRRYLSTISVVEAVVGNSSSGLYEVPSFKKPTVDIGDRQKGRLRASSVVHSQPDRTSIRKAIDQALRLDCSGARNPYGDGHAAEKIHRVLREQKDFKALLQKRFVTDEAYA